MGGQRYRFCIVSDLDHTMVDHHDPQYASLLEFNRIWSSRFRHDSYLVFSTGRSQESYMQLRQEVPLLTPDLLICSVGTEIYLRTPTGLELDSEWLDKLDQGWNRAQIVSIVEKGFPSMKPQADSEQRPHKVSYHLQEKDEAGVKYVQRLRDELTSQGLRVKVVHSGGSDVDVLPECASKGLALQFLQNRWKEAGELPLEGIQVNGDSGNDAELFEVPDVYGCIVSNAMKELVDWADAHPGERIFRATERCAAGILETMHHFGKVPTDRDLPAEARARQALVELYRFRMAWLNGAVHNADGTLQKEVALRLADGFSMTATDGTTFDKAGFVSDAKADYGRSKAGPELFWLDCMQAEAAEGGWRVTFDLWRKPAEGSKVGPQQYTAQVVSSDAAPEGLAIASLQGQKN